MNVIVTGSLGYDYIMDFPGRFADRIMPEKIHQISLSFLVNKLSKQFGGTAGNIAYTLKLLGIEPLILSSAGNDFSEYKTHLNRFRISTNSIMEYGDVTNGSYFVVTDQEDNQIGAYYTGALKHNSALSLGSDLKLSKGLTLPQINFVVIAPNAPEAMKKYIFECQRDKLPYLYDPAFQIDNFTAKELHSGITGAAILIGNDYEIALMEKKLGISHKELLGFVPIVITTLGSKGSIIETVSSSFWQAKRVQNPKTEVAYRQDSTSNYLKLSIRTAKPKNTSDPTGAGDAYRAGFVAGYLRGFNLKTCGQMGSVAAVYTVEKYGTQTHMFTIGQFIKRYQENYQQTLKL